MSKGYKVEGVVVPENSKKNRGNNKKSGFLGIFTAVTYHYVMKNFYGTNDDQTD